MAEVPHKFSGLPSSSEAESLHSPIDSERDGWFNRFIKFRERPLGRFTTGLAMLVLAGMMPQEGKTYEKVHIASSANIIAGPTGALDLKIPVGDSVTTLHLTDWEDISSTPSYTPETLIQPDAMLENIATTNDTFTDSVGLTPPEIKDQAAFTSWVEAQAQREDLLKALDITPASTMTPRQLVDLSASIAMANLDYGLDPTTGDHGITYSLPMDENLMEGRSMHCEGYAGATLAIFNELKKLYPTELRNTHMTTQSGIQEAHVWNLVIQMQSPHEASVAFIDATADDPSFTRTEPEIHLGFIQLIEGLFDKGVIDEGAFRLLVQQYQEKYDLSQRDLDELAYDELALATRDKG